MKNKKTVQDRLDEFSNEVRKRLLPIFRTQRLNFPPDRMLLVGLKQEKLLELWVADKGKPYQLLKTYPIIGNSGTLGPKQVEGDRQMPEGLYKIESLNPNSRFHLSLRVNYPNHFDRTMAELDDRDNLGGDIMIHGGQASIGCLAMGDPAIEELFILAALTGIDNIEVILSPVDFRKQNLPKSMPRLPEWTESLYANIRTKLKTLH